MIPEPLRVVRDDLLARLAVVHERVEAHHPDCQRRHALDAVADARRRIAGAETFPEREYDSTYGGLDR
jgi:hypothetical protein